ncbi:hypothetical protein GW17_00044719 [Ensete ventricosum]|nr:hypothetical protein GW17_00044719 [Ensete ventricosum]RZR77953.1 hypothetical protein BHM03_00003171 [Ensete ventricosum]
MKNVIVIDFTQVKVRSIFHAPCQKFKILVIPNVLALGKSYEHSFMKKYDGYKLCAKLCFNRFFMHCLRNSKILPFPMY